MQTDDLPNSEDCLTLNVWRPAAAAADARLPVIVWIYGGVLAHGNTAQYPLHALAAQGIVAVSMNYRMGRLGFFAHPALADEAPGEPRGNYGHLDQRAALQWVQRNIAEFGGDPGQVTLFGESAGGASVLAHTISPLSRGLFHRVILESPGVPTPRAKALPLTELRDAEQRAIAYARSVGINRDGAEGLAALRALPAETLIDGASAGQILAGMMKQYPVVGVSGAILDGQVFPETPEAAYAAGRQAMVPLIVGANSADLGVGLAASKDDLFALFGRQAAEARAVYDPDGSVPLELLTDQVLGQGTLIEPSRHVADEAARAAQPTWWYRFSYVADSARADQWGTLHGYEIPYVINVPEALPLIGAPTVSDNDRAMAAQASAYWVNFAKGADPNGAGLPAWPRHDPAVDRVLNFTNDGVVIGPDPYKSRLDLWQAVREQGG
jgi:para-nitrobenzyl esterase